MTTGQGTLNRFVSFPFLAVPRGSDVVAAPLAQRKQRAVVRGGQTPTVFGVGFPREKFVASSTPEIG